MLKKVELSLTRMLSIGKIGEKKSGLFYTWSYLDKFFNIPLEAHLFSLQILTISRHSLMPRGIKLLDKMHWKVFCVEWALMMSSQNLNS